MSNKYSQYIAVSLQRAAYMGDIIGLEQSYNKLIHYVNKSRDRNYVNMYSKIQELLGDPIQNPKDFSKYILESQDVSNIADMERIHKL